MITKQCSTCKKVYPDTPKNFPCKRRQCRACRNACKRRHYKEHRERVTAYNKKYAEEHPKQIAAAHKRYQEKHREQIAAHGKKYREEHREERAAYREEHREERAAYRRAYGKALRLEVLNHYAPDGLRCACCGEGHVEFLCVDHIDGHGNQHRKNIGASGGQAMYLWLRKNGFPKGFRILCFNCNASRGIHGYCPHKH